jgi:hypothetical protein
MSADTALVLGLLRRAIYRTQYVTGWEYGEKELDDVTVEVIKKLV